MEHPCLSFDFNRPQGSGNGDNDDNDGDDHACIGSTYGMEGIKAVKRHNSQYDLFNRLHSIASDQAFVGEVSEAWYEGRFEVVRMLYPPGGRMSRVEVGGG